MKKIVLKCMGVLLGTLIVVFLAGCGKDTTYYVEAEGETTSTQKEEVLTEDGEDSQKEKILYIYVCGQVKSPGVYTLVDGSRVMDLFAAAGGLTDEAATEYWNQARLLIDGEMIYVPSGTVIDLSHADFDLRVYSADRRIWVDNWSNLGGTLILPSAYSGKIIVTGSEGLNYVTVQWA